MSADTQTPAPRRPSRRTLAAGAAWAVPVVAVTAASPAYAASGITTTTTTKPPCVGDIDAVGGTYPVNFDLSGCTTDGTHWDFRFDITAAARNGTDCDCDDFRVTLFDNPTRSRLWIFGGSLSDFDDWSTSTAPSPRLYVQKTLMPGATATFPDNNDDVNRVASSPYTGFDTGGTKVGDITALGTANDTVHVLFNANGSIPCTNAPVNAQGPMAFYRIECGKNGSYTQLGGIGQIDPCIPMIEATVCRYRTSGNGRFTLGISVLKSCGVASADFEIRDVRRNNDPDSPTDSGSSVYSGADQPLNGGTTYINTTSDGSGSYLWIQFTTDDGDNLSWIRVPTNTTTCTGPTTTTSTTAAPPAPVLSLVSNTCDNNNGNNNDTRTVQVQWTGSANRIDRATNASFTQGLVTTTDGSSPNSQSFNDGGCNSTYYFRAYTFGQTNYSNTLVVTP